MKVKVGNKVYDGEVEPVMVILSNGEKKQIADMPSDLHKYCIFPDTEEWLKEGYKKIKEWMANV